VHRLPARLVGPRRTRATLLHRHLGRALVADVHLPGAHAPRQLTARERYDDLIRLYMLPASGDLPAGRLDAALLSASTRGSTAAGSWRANDKPRAGHMCWPLSTSTTRKVHAA
jgi:hypothetical protein